jgi:Sporulation related domain.
MKFRLIVLLSLVLFLCTGCNWVKKNLGLMTPQEIEQLNALIASSNVQKAKNTDSLASNLSSESSDTTNLSDSNSQQQTTAIEAKEQSNAVRETNLSTSQVSNKPIQKQETSRALSSDNRYYIICGSFKEKANSDKLYNKISELGGNPIKVESKGGLIMVGVGGYATSEEAVQEIDKWVNKGICSRDAWIYDAKKNNK